MIYLDQMIGKPLSEVEHMLKSDQASYRIVKMDGQARVCIRNVDLRRYNLEVDNDIVTHIHMG